MDQKSIVEIVCPHCSCDSADQLEVKLPQALWITVKELKTRPVFCNQCSKEFKIEGK